MTANQILHWLGFGQGRASKRAIRRAWSELPDNGMTTGEVQSIFSRIGCEVGDE